MYVHLRFSSQLRVESLKAGLRAVIPGAITVGVVATLLQLGCNEFAVQRLKLIARQRLSGDGSIPADPQPGPTSRYSELSEHKSTSLKTRVLSLLGIRKLSEDEYLQRLKIQRDHYLLQIAKLEQQLEEEKKTDNVSDSD